MEVVYSLAFIETQELKEDYLYQAESEKEREKIWSYLKYWLEQKFKNDTLLIDEENYTITWGGGSFTVQIPLSLDLSLEGEKHRYLLLVAEDIEEARQKYITPGAGQAMHYLLIKEEADRFLSDPNPVEDKYPLLSSETDLGMGSLEIVAKNVIAIATEWIKLQANFNLIRRKAQDRIRSATSIEEIAIAYQDFSRQLLE